MAKLLTKTTAALRTATERLIDVQANLYGPHSPFALPDGWEAELAALGATLAEAEAVLKASAERTRVYAQAHESPAPAHVDVDISESALFPDAEELATYKLSLRTLADGCNGQMRVRLYGTKPDLQHWLSTVYEDDGAYAAAIVDRTLQAQEAALRG